MGFFCKFVVFTLLNLVKLKPALNLNLESVERNVKRSAHSYSFAYCHHVNYVLEAQSLFNKWKDLVSALKQLGPSGAGR